MYSQVPVSPPGSSASFEEGAEAYAQQTLETQVEPVSYDGEEPKTASPIPTKLGEQIQKRKQSPSFPKLLSLGRGSILRLSLLSEFFIYSMVWAVINLLRYELSEEIYKVVATATQPVFVWLLLMLLFIINAARQSSAQTKFKDVVMDFSMMANADQVLERTYKKQCSLSEQANTVLAIALSYLLVYIVLA